MIEVKATIYKIKYSRNRDYKILKGLTIPENVKVDFLVPCYNFYLTTYRFIGDEPRLYTRQWSNGQKYNEIVMKPIIIKSENNAIEMDCSDFWKDR